jgi:hydroxypyruvate isomerase
MEDIMSSIKFAASIGFLFGEFPLTERIEKAREYGFDAVEFASWKDIDMEAVKKKCDETGIAISNFTGIVENQVVVPENYEACIKEFKDSLKAAKYLDCSNLVIHVNTVNSDMSVEPLPRQISDEEKDEAIYKVVNTIVPIAEENDITLSLEPLNTLVDHAGYYFERSDKAFELVEKIDSEKFKLLYDIYHMYIMGEKIISILEDKIGSIGYIHIADTDGRHEPGTGEIDYSSIYKKLLELGYSGYIGFEYIPSTTTEESLTPARKIFNF